MKVHYGDKVCRICKKTFTPTSPNSKWCVDCRAQARSEREREYRQQRKKDKPEDNIMHTCDSPEKVAKCLNCTRGKCIGWCDDVSDSSNKRKRKL